MTPLRVTPLATITLITTGTRVTHAQYFLLAQREMYGALDARLALRCQPSGRTPEPLPPAATVTSSTCDTRFPCLSIISFFVFPLPFVVLRVPLPCSVFVRFVLSSSCHFPFFLLSTTSLRFSFRFLSAFLGGGFCYSVIRLGAAPPPRSLRASSMRLACCLLSCVLDVFYLYFFSVLFPAARFRFGHRLLHPVFSLWVRIYTMQRCMRHPGARV